MSGDQACGENDLMTHAVQGAWGALRPGARSLFLEMMNHDDKAFQIYMGGHLLGDRSGNSTAYLRLSKLGWDFGKLTQSGSCSLSKSKSPLRAGP